MVGWTWPDTCANRVSGLASWWLPPLRGRLPFQLHEVYHLSIRLSRPVVAKPDFNLLWRKGLRSPKEKSPKRAETKAKRRAKCARTR